LIDVAGQLGVDPQQLVDARRQLEGEREQ
jgi:hypothetical protein